MNFQSENKTVGYGCVTEARGSDLEELFQHVSKDAHCLVI